MLRNLQERYRRIFGDAVMGGVLDASDEQIRLTAFHLAIEVLVLMDVLYLRAHPGAPRVGPIGPPWEGLRAAGVVVGRRATECGCVIHSSDEHMLDLSDLLSGPRPALADVDDVAAWRVAELREAGERDARVELREDRDHPRHYRVVVARPSAGSEEVFP